MKWKLPFDKFSVENDIQLSQNCLYKMSLTQNLKKTFSFDVVKGSLSNFLLNFF